MKSYVKNYPRPQFFRDGYMILDGVWDFAFDDRNIGESKGWHTGFDRQCEIIVPFTCETQKSGIGDSLVHENIWYQKLVCLGEDWLGQSLMLHFEGSDYKTKVWVNGNFAFEHSGGYSRFSFDIAKYANVGENKIVVKVEDSLSKEQPRGKQRFHGESFVCWYVQTSGIWKSVWLEKVANTSLKSVKMTPSIWDESIIIKGEVLGAAKDTAVDVMVSFKGEKIAEVSVCAWEGYFETKIKLTSGITPWGVYRWSENQPDLYDVEFIVRRGKDVVDRVLSYFGMREIAIKGQNVLLNGKPLYQRLILDQGYWEESHLTPPSEEALIEDIKKIKAMGYNGLRKHQKVEDERFLYWCDVLGVLVWGEMAATYEFSDKAIANFTREWQEVVLQNYNHPSIITWVPFNESWGVKSISRAKEQQHFSESIYHLTKSMDSTRPVIVNDGWEHTVSDIITLHDYRQCGDEFYRRYKNQSEILSCDSYPNGIKCAFANGYSYKGQPVIVSEFGGIAIGEKNNGWGYGDMEKDSSEFLARLDSIVSGIKKVPYICGYCYTQLTDVQQEINGLLKEDRSYKVDCSAIKEINERRVEKE